VRWVQLEQFGRQVPYMPAPASLGAIAKALPSWAADFGWRAVDEPRDRRRRVHRHACGSRRTSGSMSATSCRQRMLHCPEGGAACHEPAASARIAGWSIRGFYRYTGKA
jgi:hypothetical protein